MAYTGQVSGRQKLVSGSGALLAVGAVGLGLASGLDLDVVRNASDAIAAIALPAPPPLREEAQPAKAPSEKASGKASAANKRAKAAAVAAPPPKL
ncbi:MAG: energy transducer TonB, partial [Sphingopyxis sp.]|nr:energy transducer TonB [Sphingopyxis sp.]